MDLLATNSVKDWCFFFHFEWLELASLQGYSKISHVSRNNEICLMGHNYKKKNKKISGDK